MATFRVHYVDHGGNVYATERFEHDHEQALIEELRHRNAHGIGAGFDLWHEDRLVYRHRSKNRGQYAPEVPRDEGNARPRRNLTPAAAAKEMGSRVRASSAPSLLRRNKRAA